jgi:ADP-L-glycero-D-manno-heptose 6-epimerase
MPAGEGETGLKGGLIVTGGAGFIGTNLVVALNERGRDDILVVDHLDHPEKERNLNSTRFREFMDKTAFRRLLKSDSVEDCETVFHLGACSSTTESNQDYLFDNNTRYTAELCEWSLKRGARFIYASSAATYGDGSLGYSDDPEMMPKLKPMNLYGLSKQSFDLTALKHGLLDRIVGLKYFNVYGPHENHKLDMRSVVNKAYAQIVETGELALFKSHRPEYRDGEQERDFIHVRDAVAVTLFFHDNSSVSGIYNCGTGEARTWLDLGRAVFTAMGREPRITFVEMPESIRDSYQYHTQADLTRLRAAGYTSRFLSIEEGAGDYVRNHLARRK